MLIRRLLMAALGVSLTLAGCGSKEEAASVEKPAAPAQGRLRVQVQTIADVKTVPATLTTRDMAEARARIPGVLVSLKVKEGDEVRQGQVIGVIRDERIALQTEAYAGEVQAAEAEAARATAELARTRDLFSKGVYAQARLDQVEAQAKAAAGAARAARAQRAASAELASQGEVVAPAAGRVLNADVPIGSVVTPGQSIARITAGPLLLRIELPEGQADALRTGAVVKLDARDLGGVASQGVISQVYPSITAGQVTADVTAPALPQSLIGRRVRASVQVGERQAIVIPRSYVITRFGVDFVRIVDAQGRYSETPVQIAPSPAADRVEVLSGLQAGDILTPAGGAAR